MAEESNISKHSSRLPVWVLAPREEKEARQNLKKFAYEQCGEYVQAMAACAKSNGLRVFPACDKQRDKMGECLLFYQVDTKYLDEQRDKIVQRKIGVLEEQLRQSKENK